MIFLSLILCVFFCLRKSNKITLLRDAQGFSQGAVPLPFSGYLKTFSSYKRGFQNTCLPTTTTWLQNKSNSPPHRNIYREPFQYKQPASPSLTDNYPVGHPEGPSSAGGSQGWWCHNRTNIKALWGKLFLQTSKSPNLDFVRLQFGWLRLFINFFSFLKHLFLSRNLLFEQEPYLVKHEITEAAKKATPHICGSCWTENYRL